MKKIQQSNEKVLIILMAYDPFIFSALERILDFFPKNTSIEILDVTDLSAGISNTYNQSVLKLFGKRFPDFEFLNFFDSSRISYSHISKKNSALASSCDELNEEIEEAIKSTLITTFRHSEPELKLKRAKKFREKIVREVHGLISLFTELFLEDKNISTVVIPNGRFANQKAIEITAKNFRKKIYYYDKGNSTESVYFRDYPPQARLASQSDALEITKFISSHELSVISKQWLSERSTSNNHSNLFSKIWSDGKIQEDFSAGRTVVGFFSSSQDEFLTLGDEWQIHSWENQWDAFDKFMTQASLLGYSFYLRVHPNLATKSRIEFKEEVSKFKWIQSRHSNLKIFWHDDSVNSYELLKITDVCVVWNSTIGLESSLLGIPTWACAATRYSQVADIKQALSQSEIPMESFEWDVDVTGARKFITYLGLRDLKIYSPISKWVSWNLIEPPIHVNISALLASGGTSSWIEAVRQSLYLYQNRNLRSNVLSLRRKFNLPDKIGLSQTLKK